MENQASDNAALDTNEGSAPAAAAAPPPPSTNAPPYDIAAPSKEDVPYDQMQQDPPGTGITGPTGDSKQIKFPKNNNASSADSSAGIPPEHADNPAVKRASLFRSIAQTLAGGPRYKTTIDANTGETKREAVPLSGREIGMAIALEALTGGMAGLQAGRGKGPGAAGMAGVQQGLRADAMRRQAEDEDTEAQQKNLANQAAVANTNMRMAMNARALSQGDRDAHQFNVDSYASLYQAAQKIGAVGDIVSESQLHQLLKDNSAHVTKDMAIPIQVVQGANKGAHGEPLYEERYALIKPDTKLELPDNVKQLLLKYKVPGWVNSDGQLISLPENFQARLQMIANGIEQANTYRIADEGLFGYAKGQKNFLHKDTAPGGAASPQSLQFKDDSIGSQVDDAAGKYDVDKNILRSLVLTESNGNPNARSDKNAKGLGQLTDPISAKYHVDNPYDPAKNLDGAAHYLSDLISQNKGDVRKALIAYHGAGSDGHTTGEQYADMVMNRAKVGAPEGSQGESEEDIRKRVEEVSGNLMPEDKQLLAKLGHQFFVSGKPGEMSPAQKMVEQGKLDGTSVARITAAFDKLSPIDDYRRGVEKDNLDLKAQADLEKKNNEEKQIIKRNDPLIESMLSGKMFNLYHIATMRAYDRETIVNEAIRRAEQRGIEWNPEEINAAIKLYDEASGSSRQTAGSFANSVGNAKTSLSHIGGALGALDRLKAKYPSVFTDTKIMDKGLSALNDQFGTDPDWTKLKADLRTAGTDWQNLLNNQHALHQEDTDWLRDNVSEKAPFKNIEGGLQEMAHTAAARIVPLNDRWRDVFKNNYPDLLNDEAARAISRINDPEVDRLLGDMEVGGSLRGSSTGAGQPGRKVGDLVQQYRSQAQNNQVKNVQNARVFPGQRSNETPVLSQDGTQVIGFTVPGVKGYRPLATPIPVGQ